MNVANLYRKLKRILNNSNEALVNKGLNAVNTLNKIPIEIEKLGEINLLPYVVRNEIIEITEEDIRGCQTIGFRAFQKCTNLTNVTIPDGVTTIGDYAFSACTNLTNVIIPNSVITIGSSVFDWCTNLTNVTIPDGVTSIGYNAFNYCTSLTDIYLYPTTPPTLQNTNAISTATTTIHVPIGCGDAYKNATNWSNFADKIVEDIEI